jgi:hypothetical protein
MAAVERVVLAFDAQLLVERVVLAFDAQLLVEVAVAPQLDDVAVCNVNYKSLLLELTYLARGFGLGGCFLGAATGTLRCFSVFLLVVAQRIASIE